MKWFRHNTDSYCNIKLQAILHEFGLQGYALYWLCLELVGQQGMDEVHQNEPRLNQNRTWMHSLCTISGLEMNQLQAWLKRFGELELIDSKSLQEGKLYIPKMLEYLDEYTLRRVSRQTRELKGTLYGNVLYCKDFEDIWSKYPNRVGKKEAYRHYQATVKTPEDIKNIGLALDNYLVSDIAMKEYGKYIQNGKTWFNNWEDWIVPPKNVPKEQWWDKYKKKRER